MNPVSIEAEKWIRADECRKLLEPLGPQPTDPVEWQEWATRRILLFMRVCRCGDCCGCKGAHAKGFCLYPNCALDKPIPNAEEITMFATKPLEACKSLRNRSGIGIMDAKRIFEGVVTNSSPTPEQLEAAKEICRLLKLDDRFGYSAVVAAYLGVRDGNRPCTAAPCDTIRAANAEKDRLCSILETAVKIKLLSEPGKSWIIDEMHGQHKSPPGKKTI